MTLPAFRFDSSHRAKGSHRVGVVVVEQVLRTVFEA
jgi:hypothetical protein